jgi:outer membrane protein
MKKYVMLIALFSLCFGVSAQAQTPKFGHINVEDVFNLMPERDSAFTKYQVYYADIEDTYASINQEYQAKLTEYQQKQATWSAVVLETKTQELVSFQQRLEQYPQIAQEDLEQQRNTLFMPLYNKINEAIKKVGKELGLIYVFNSAGMPYIDENQSMHLLDKVKAELKIPAGKVSPTPIGNQGQR